MDKNEIGKEFSRYSKLDHRIDSKVLESYVNGLTPYILEERTMNVTQMDIFSRLLKDRILWVTGAVDGNMQDVIQAQLLFLQDLDKTADVKMYISSPGGSVLSGLAIRDTMDLITPDVATTNIGMAASMGSILLSSGTKGKRSSLISSRVMTHMVSHGMQGNVQDTRISQLEGEKYNYILFKILAQNCGKSFDEIFELSRRDKWFNSEEALNMGLIDEIIGLKDDNTNSISSLMEGFDEYYEREVLKKN